MSLNDALSIALAGIRVNQSNMALVSSNVSNVETPGYVRKAITQVTTVGAQTGTGVRVTGVSRELDEYIQAQLRTETSGASYASMRSSFLQQLQGLYGNPGEAGTLEYAFNNLTTAVQSLATSPDSQSARIGVVNAANVMAQQLNSMSNGIQNMRGQAETGIKDSVNLANDLMSQVANINLKLSSNLHGANSMDSSTAALLDQRDRAISQLATLMDVRVTHNASNQVTIFTSSGVQLVGMEAARLTFDARGSVNALSEWSSDPSKSTLGTLRVEYGSGATIDLTGHGGINSGKIAAYLEMRDSVLVEAQTQLDELAAKLSQSLSSYDTAATEVTAGERYDVALNPSTLKPGDKINISYTDTLTNQQRNVTVILVDDPTVLPLPASNDPNHRVIGGDFSGGIAGLAAQLNTELNVSNLQFSSAGSTLSIMNSAGFSTVRGASLTSTATAAQNGGVAIGLFTDNGQPYTGAITSSGLQSRGLASRLSVDRAIQNDPTLLVKYNASTAAGDTSRPEFILAQLSGAKFAYSAASGVGSSKAPFTGTLLSYMQQFLSQQGASAEQAKLLADGQNVVVNTLAEKLNTSSGVNMDEEMAHLLALQNAYAANARVLSTVNEMYKILMQAM